MPIVATKTLQIAKFLFLVSSNYIFSYVSNIEEKEIYWFHPDHLGSSSFITGLDGEVTQNMEYFPSGEIFVENHMNDGLNSQYKFNGKEQDAETGYYYYGARYYNPRVSLWLNVDPLAEALPERSPYEYTFSNPIRYTDPTGMYPVDPVIGYHNTSVKGALGIFEEGFKSIKIGWNFFMSNPNGRKAGSTVANQPVQLRVELNMSGAKTINYKQWRAFYDAAKERMGWGEIENSKLTKDQIKTINAIRNQDAARYMTESGSDAFIIEAEAGASGQKFYALSNKAVNSNVSILEITNGSEFFDIVPESTPKGGMFRYGRMALRAVGEGILIEGTIQAMRQKHESMIHYVQRRSLNGRSPFMNWMLDTYSDVGLYYWNKYSLPTKK